MIESAAQKRSVAANLRLVQGGSPEVVHAFGTVQSEQGHFFVVETETSEYSALRAASCLLSPKVGDRVLIAADAKGECFILSVLVRNPKETAVIAHEGDLHLRIGGGKLGIVARDGVSVLSGGEVSLVTDGLTASAHRADLALDELRSVSKSVQVDIGKAKVIGEAIDGFFQRLSYRVKRVFRVVDELDHLKAKRMNYNVEQVMQMHAGNAVVSAEELVKVDGEQIHLG